jgi:hypothetical protein
LVDHRYEGFMAALARNNYSGIIVG